MELVRRQPENPRPQLPIKIAKIICRYCGGLPVKSTRKSPHASDFRWSRLAHLENLW